MSDRAELAPALSSDHYPGPGAYKTAPNSFGRYPLSNMISSPAYFFTSGREAWKKVSKSRTLLVSGLHLKISRPDAVQGDG